MHSKYMTAAEVAAELEVSTATITRWVRDGILPAKRFGTRIIRILRTDVERMIGQES
jgi:excisionase family DNA binding protein